MQGKFGQVSCLDDNEKAHLAEELQLAKGCSVQSVRAPAANAVDVVVRPADSLERERVVATGTTRELRSGSVIVQTERPVAIGAFYELQFDGISLGAPVVFGRCDQVTMLAEHRFDARFQFLQPVVLPGPETGNNR